MPCTTSFAKLDLITEESDRCQFRFEDIVDIDTGKVLFTIDTRSAA